MNPRMLKTSELAGFIKDLNAECDVIGPKAEADYLTYGPIAEASDLVLDGRPRMSAKSVFFPQTETMFSFKVGDSKQQETALGRPQILLGVRGCDLNGIDLLDKVFMSGQFQDSFYRRRRENSIVVAIACKEMGADHFCNSFGIDPYEPKAGDALMIEVSDGLVFKALTEKGEALIKDLPEASAEALAEVQKSAEHYKETQNDEVPVKEFAEKVKDVFESDVWKKVVDGCLNCGACTYVCPTCHCFDIFDEKKKDAGQRVRAWDSCMAWKFTMHTSGHNPRTTPDQRIRQRLLHKFQYINKNLDTLGCSGCGRCVESCPVNWDIRDAIRRINAEL